MVTAADWTDEQNKQNKFITDITTLYDSTSIQDAWLIDQQTVRMSA